MEIPVQLKTLYKHWEKHTSPRNLHTYTSPQVDKQILSQIIAFINERMSIYEKKSHGKAAPYTTDPILATYKFCNIYRELDKQTIYYHTLLKPYENDFPLWLLNMLFCRSICRIETIEIIGLLSFDDDQNEAVFERLLRLPSPKYGDAYIFPISVIQKSQWPTRETFFCRYYPLISQEIAKTILTFKNTSVTEALVKLIPLLKFPLKFLLTEVLIDVAYQYPDHIDLFKEFPVGPGSKPTMHMLSTNLNPESVVMALTEHQKYFGQINLLTYNKQPVYLSAENWEGIGCEFRKYTNLKNGSGRKRKYKPAL